MPYLGIILAGIDRLLELARPRPQSSGRASVTHVRSTIAAHADRAIVSLAVGAEEEAVRATLDATCLLAEHGLGVDWRHAAPRADGRGQPVHRRRPSPLVSAYVRHASGYACAGCIDD